MSWFSVTHLVGHETLYNQQNISKYVRLSNRMEPCYKLEWAKKASFPNWITAKHWAGSKKYAPTSYITPLTAIQPVKHSYSKREIPFRGTGRFHWYTPKTTTARKLTTTSDWLRFLSFFMYQSSVKDEMSKRKTLILTPYTISNPNSEHLLRTPEHMPRKLSNTSPSPTETI